MIITSETNENKGKTKIIVSQLEDLNMKYGEDYCVYKLDPDDEETGHRKVLISIKFTQEQIDKKAHELGMNASLSNPYVKYFVKCQFFYDKKGVYNMFDSIERQIAMV